MDRKELEIILKEGEGYKNEFKEGLSNLEKEIVAFANSSGGRVLLGVTDYGKIKGIPVTNELKSNSLQESHRDSFHGLFSQLHYLKTSQALIL